MQGISIERDGEVLGHHTTESSFSSYGQPVWIVEVEDPEPGPAIWCQGENEQQLDIVGTKGGWLVVRQSDGYLAGIIWSDGDYFAAIIEDAEGNPCRELSAGARVRGTIQFDSRDPDDLGAVVAGL